MSKFGVIFCAFQSLDYLPASLTPWVNARVAKLGGHEYVICGVSVPFVGFDGQDDGTVEAMRGQLAAGQIDNLITSDVPLTEVDARGRALRWLVDQGADALIQVDVDEFYTTDEIARIIAFVEARPHVAWFCGSLKNYVGIGGRTDTYLVEPFAPPRVHRVTVGGYRAHSFWDDNNVLYGGIITRDLKRDVDFSSATIPKPVAWVRHESWPPTLRSKRKIEYQLNARGWPTCTFDWDDSRGGLIWRDGVNPPEVARD